MGKVAYRVLEEEENAKLDAKAAENARIDAQRRQLEEERKAAAQERKAKKAPPSPNRGARRRPRQKPGRRTEEEPKGWKPPRNKVQGGLSMDREMRRQYTVLVDFLGHILGPDYEVALTS